MHILLKKVIFIAIIVSVYLCASSCTPQERKSRDFIAEGMKSRKIKRVTDAQLLSAATDFGKKAINKLNEVVLPKIDASKPFDCQIAQYLPKDTKFMYVMDYRLVCQETQAKYEKEKQIFQAYNYNSLNDKELTENIQKIDNEAIIYTAPFTINGKFIGMWTMVMDKKMLVMNIN